MNYRKPIVILIASLIAVGVAHEKAFADNQFMTQGIQEYNAGDYENAAGHLGAALTTEFNNAKLHYYLASAYSHLKKHDDAVREFRIAYALQPDGEVGGYAKQALGALGADVREPKGSDAAPAAVAKAPPPPQSDPYLNHTMSALQQQAEQEKNLRTGVGQSTADNISKTGKDVVQRSQADALNNSPHYYSRRSGSPYPVTLSPDVKKQLDSMQQMYDQQKDRYLQSSQQEAQEIQKSSQNLQSLLNDNPKSGTKLVPAGTNLFIRNYQPVKPTK